MTDVNFPAGVTKGLMAFWSDIAMPHQPAYQRWHNNEHIPERLSIPGFVRGRRYRSVTNELRFLMYYDTTSLDVLTSDEYLARLNAPTPRTSAALQWFKNGNRTAYKLFDALGPLERAAPPVIATASFAPPVSGTQTSDEIQHLRRSSMQRLITAGGLDRVLEYRLDDAGSIVSSGEASVHKATTSAAEGLLVLHSHNLALLDDASGWQALDDALRQWASLNAIGELPQLNVYSLEFSLQNDSYFQTEGGRP